jgi:hypothetical protein
MCICIYIYTIYIYILFITSVRVYEACFLQTKDLFFGTASLRFCCGSLRSNAQSLTQASTMAMNSTHLPWDMSPLH